MQTVKSVISLLRPLSYFVVSVRQGSFSAAAKEMNLTPSVVSRTVSELEEKLGFQLLHRSKSALSLTNEGRAVYETASAMLENAARAETTLTAHRTQIQGPVRLTAPTVFAVDWLPQFTRKLQQQHPEVELFVDYDDGIRDGLDDDVDLAFRVQASPPEKYSHELLDRYEVILVAHPDLVPPGRDYDDPALLNQLPAIGRTGARVDPLTRTFFHSDTGAPLRYEGKPALHLNHGGGILMMALAGVGSMITLEPFLRSHLQQGQLVRLLPSYDFGSVNCYAVWRSTKLSPTLKALIHIAKQIGQTLPS